MTKHLMSRGNGDGPDMDTDEFGTLQLECARLLPDEATGVWDANDRSKMLVYLLARDGERCGLCGMKMTMLGANIEHMIPKKFDMFVVRGGKAFTAADGVLYESKMHHPDNLQASHDYCNKAKGNTPITHKWRHPIMPSLEAANQYGCDGPPLLVPCSQQVKCPAPL